MDELTSEIEAIVREFFDGDESKVSLWFETPNPMFGDIAPRVLVRRLETLQKLHALVKERKLSNRLASDSESVLAAATQLSGDADLATQWFRDHAIADMHRKTPMQLVFEGRTADVLKYLEMLEAGPVG